MPKFEYEVDWPDDEDYARLNKMTDPDGEWRDKDWQDRRLFTKTILEVWLNDRGARGWKLRVLDADFMGIFERKIEINKKLRAIQTGEPLEEETDAETKDE